VKLAWQLYHKRGTTSFMDMQLKENFMPRTSFHFILLGLGVLPGMSDDSAEHGG